MELGATEGTTTESSGSAEGLELQGGEDLLAEL